MASKTVKRILAVKVSRIVDSDADTSYLGEYSRRPDSEYAIDRAHTEDCTAQIGNSQTAQAKQTLAKPRKISYVRQDYDRMESLNRGDWYYIVIKAEAEVQLTGGTVQRIHSGGLWGTESDSEESYLASIEQEELAELKTELIALGFSKRAIAKAFQTIERKDS